MARILVIDDDVQIRTLLKEILQQEGYEVVDAPDGLEGVRLYREDPADLVITDIIMPEKEGLEIIRELRTDFPEVKIMAISGGGRIGPEPYLQIAQRLGAQSILTKPIGRDELIGAVREALKEF